MDAGVRRGDCNRCVQRRVCADAHDIQILGCEHFLVVKVSAGDIVFIGASVECIAIDIAQRGEADILQICVSGGVAPANPTTPDDACT